MLADVGILRNCVAVGSIRCQQKPSNKCWYNVGIMTEHKYFQHLLSDPSVANKSHSTNVGTCWHYENSYTFSTFAVGSISCQQKSFNKCGQMLALREFIHVFSICCWIHQLSTKIIQQMLAHVGIRRIHTHFQHLMLDPSVANKMLTKIDVE